MRTVKSSKNIYRLSYIVLLTCIKMVLNACPAAFHEMFIFLCMFFFIEPSPISKFCVCMGELKKIQYPEL